MAVLGLESGEAKVWLADVCGVSIPRGATVPRAAKRKLERETSEEVGLIYPPMTSALWTPGGPDKALEYLRGRGVTDSEIARYRIAAVPETAPKYAGRVIVPVFIEGVLVDFVARLYVTKPKIVPKALSGRRDLGARKELSLWGYDLLDPSIRRVHVTEGVWGALALLRVGLPNVSAACGSSWSDERTELLAPWDEVVLIPDGDPAGSKMEQVAGASLRFTHRVLVADLPRGAQPDHDPSVTLEAVERARPAQISGIAQALPKKWSGKE
jgi:DNA primase